MGYHQMTSNRMILFLVASLGLVGCGFGLSQPHWLRQLAEQPIIPGVGLAGVAIGDPESKVVSVLGSPSDEIPVRTTSGELLGKVLAYKHAGVFLGVKTTPGTHVVRTMRLYDSDFDHNHQLPRLKGVGVGSSEARVRQAFGEPASTFEHGTCPASLSDPRATQLRYPGVSFCVCAANHEVLWVDIP